MANKQSSKDLRSIRRRLDQLLDSGLRSRIQVCLPKSLSREFLVAHTPTGVEEDAWIACAWYIVNRVLLATMRADFKRRKQAQRWVWLPIGAFRDVAPKKYQVIRQQLLDTGILQCDNDYDYKAGLTYGYRLGKHFRYQPIKFRTLKTGKVNTLLLRRARQEVKEQKQRISEMAHVAKGWLDYEAVNIDKVEALRFLHLYRTAMHRRVTLGFFTGSLGVDERDERLATVRNQYIHAKRQIKKWGKQPALSVDDKGGRFYNPLVSLTSPLRHFVTYKGEALVSFDLKNSQPLHLLLLLHKDFWRRDARQTWSLRKLDEELWQEVTRDGQEIASLSTERNKSRQAIGSEPTKMTHFAQLVLEGQLYEFMAEHFRGKYLNKQGKDRFGTRELAKGEVLKLLYFDPSNSYSPSQKPYKEFRRLFPDVAGYIDKLKRQDYTAFPVLLQKLEAHIMLHKVGPRIYDQNPDAWFTTIHDAIVTTAEHASLVHDVILATYQEILGTPPRVGRTDLTPAAARRELTEYVRRKFDQNFGTSNPEVLLDDLNRLLNLRGASSPTVPDEAVLLDYPFASLPATPELPNPFAKPKRGLKR